MIVISLVLLVNRSFKTRADNLLKVYVSAADPSFDYKVESSDASGARLSITSQTWHGIVWKHAVEIQNPQLSVPALAGLSILEIMGDSPTDDRRASAQSLANSAGCPVVSLYDIPNQPLFGKEEDDLVAETFENYVHSGDSSWPLLCPMVKSVKAAMDAVQKFSSGKDRKFVVMGASKRGWTAWLTAGLGDSRVVGVVPTSFQMVNIPAQLAWQKRLWGEVNPIYAAYLAEGLPQNADSAAVKNLIGIVDPWSLFPVRCKTLIVTGSNDAFWTVDALRWYKPKLRSETWLYTAPNGGHDLPWSRSLTDDVAAFANICGSRLSLPHVHSVQLGLTAKIWSTKRPEEIRLYTSESKDGKFDSQQFRLARVFTPSSRKRGKTFRLTLPKPRLAYQAWFVQCAFTLPLGGGGRRLEISTPTILKATRAMKPN